MIDGSAEYDGQNLDVYGTVEYLSATDNTWQPLSNAQVHVGNPQQGLGAQSWLGYSSPTDSSGYFDFTTQISLNPGMYSVWLYLTGSGVPPFSDATYSYTFSDSNATASVYYALTITLTSDTYTINTVPNGASNTATISVSTNSPVAYPVTLSATCPSGVFDACQLSTTSVSPSTSPLTSKLTVHAPNSTSPGTYKIGVTASASIGIYPTSQTIQITVIVQKNTRSLVISIQGLPSGVQTSLLLDNGMSYALGSTTQTITVRNGTQWIQATQEIDSASGDTRYICSNNQQSTTDPSVSAFTFTYVTQYRLRITATSLPAVKGMKLMLTVNGVNASKIFDPTVGFTDYYPANTIVTFTLTPSYVTTNTLDYNFTGWTDSSGKVLTPPYMVTIMKPYAVDASYTQWVEVALSTDLPSNMSSIVQITTPDGGTNLVNLVGGTQYPAGIFTPGSSFQCNVPQNQTTLYGPGGPSGSVRYVYQLMMPASPIMLSKHTTIQIHYETQYKIQVSSQLPNTVVQPSGGTLWASAGSNVTVQVKATAQDSNWIPYVFDSWTGLPQATNQTNTSFIVNGPLTVGVQWRPNWTYILIMVGAVAGVTIPGTLLGRRKIMAWRESRAEKKKVPEQGEETTEPVAKRKFEDLGTADNDGDMRLYNYIIEKGGSISIPNAMKELKMTREEITNSISRIKEKGLLG
jgi:hypothetical protein